MEKIQICLDDDFRYDRDDNELEETIQDLEDAGMLVDEIIETVTETDLRLLIGYELHSWTDESPVSYIEHRPCVRSR